MYSLPQSYNQTSKCKRCISSNAYALKTFETEKEARNFFKYATSEVIRFAFLLTDESLTSLAKKVPDLLDYSDRNGVIDYNGNIDFQLYNLFRIDKKNQLHIKKHLIAKTH